jgi:general secretion pathway protein A
MYYRHFGLSGPPFQFAMPPGELFMSRPHREALAALEWGLLHEPSGFTLLLGESGTGKTSLVSAVLARRYETVRAVCLADPKLSFTEMLRFVVQRIVALDPPAGKADLTASLDAFLAKLKRGERLVIVIDEAQDLEPANLEELRLLSNHGRPDEKQLCFILVGQPEFARTLALPALNALSQRIGARATLAPLSREEAEGYVGYRLKRQNGTIEQVFSPSALNYLLAQSRRIPRRINTLCHNAMLLAYAAGATRVSAAIARLAVREYDGFTGGRAVGLARCWAARLCAAAKTQPLRRAGVLAAAAGLGFIGAQALLSGFPAAERASSNAAEAAHSDSPLKMKLPQPALLPRHRLRTVSAAFRPEAVSEAATTPIVLGPKADAGRLGNPKAPTASTAQPPIMDRPPAASESSPRMQVVRVKPGDTLTGLAQRYLGSATRVKDLELANSRLRNADLLYPGQEIDIPTSRLDAADTGAR